MVKPTRLVNELGISNAESVADGGDRSDCDEKGFGRE